VAGEGVHCTDRGESSTVLILLNKPYRVLCQFTDADGRPTLADHVKNPDVYPAGRLDFDSEGLLVLTDDGRLQARISRPGSKIRKRYWAQVEGTPSTEQLRALKLGITLKDGDVRAIDALAIEPPAILWDRDPPIRYRKNVTDSWIEITLSAGKNRQVRRMTAEVGLPTLRLIRCAIGPWTLDGLTPGESREMSTEDAWNELLRRI
jgi:23S rRNA pseudouridine2457 synthase